MSAPLLVAALSAPLVAFDPTTPKIVLHAASGSAVIAAWPRPEGERGETWEPPTPLIAACGEFDLRLMEIHDDFAPFPPRVKGLPDGWTRCRECHKATGQKSPRCEITLGEGK